MSSSEPVTLALRDEHGNSETWSYRDQAAPFVSLSASLAVSRLVAHLGTPNQVRCLYRGSRDPWLSEVEGVDLGAALAPRAALFNSRRRHKADRHVWDVTLAVSGAGD